jgi:hypothetical protein
MRKAVGGGSPLVLKAVAEAIKASKVRGFPAEKVKADILAFFKGPELELVDYVLFEGRVRPGARNGRFRLPSPF